MSNPETRDFEAAFDRELTPGDIARMLPKRVGQVLGAYAERPEIGLGTFSIMGFESTLQEFGVITIQTMVDHRHAAWERADWEAVEAIDRTMLETGALEDATHTEWTTTGLAVSKICAKIFPLPEA